MTPSPPIPPRVGILASREPYREHCQPIWDGLEPAERGCFVTEGSHREGEAEVWLTASASDHDVTRRLPGLQVVMEHGTGLEFYAGQTLARRIRADVILAPNDFIAERYRDAGARGRIEVVGTPKMDALSWVPTPSHDTVCVSFHWTGRRERPSVLEHYREAVVALASRVRLIGHAHPRIWGHAEKFYRECGIEPVERFSDVVARAFVYCVDHSSTAYEWVALGRPVVLMERPEGPKSVPHSTGLGYEHWAYIGAHARPETLESLALGALDGDQVHAAQRLAAAAALYPRIGTSTGYVVDVLRSLA